MLLADKRGIICDHCSMSVIEKFIYFSFDLQELVVRNNIVPALKTTAVPIFSFDICQHCMEDFKAIILKCYKPTRILPNRSCPQGIFCDLTGNHMHGNFTCYCVNVSEVSVNISLTPTATVTDHNYLELWIGSDAFEQLKTRAIDLRKNKEALVWSSSSI